MVQHWCFLTPTSWPWLLPRSNFMTAFARSSFKIQNIGLSILQRNHSPLMRNAWVVSYHLLFGVRVCTCTREQKHLAKERSSSQTSGICRLPGNEQGKRPRRCNSASLSLSSLPFSRTHACTYCTANCRMLQQRSEWKSQSDHPRHLHCFSLKQSVNQKTMQTESTHCSFPGENCLTGISKG